MADSTDFIISLVNSFIPMNPVGSREGEEFFRINWNLI